jgi:hypothetical protein
MSVLNHPYESNFARRFFDKGKAAGLVEGEARGEARGEAKALLAVLDVRGFEVPDDVQNRITECTDIGQLDVWVRRAVRTNKVDDLFYE